MGRGDAALQAGLQAVRKVDGAAVGEVDLEVAQAVDSARAATISWSIRPSVSRRRHHGSADPSRATLSGLRRHVMIEHMIIT